ncbi:hypothetical protein BH695_3179 [Microcystis aeruginosa PCC 7806SL]|uniref:Uncharacterized protein n=2 Tax=Microcystis TaxID=1125 RepID=A0A0K1RZB8_9CHRO|nr:hypothetical protein VL20_2128 [Microcystis panniformis FACHB-1757]ARI82458.1 hypothetical protein BH695_3179 [Microcystis aeruginosa PCC 7806SL]
MGNKENSAIFGYLFRSFPQMLWTKIDHTWRLMFPLQPLKVSK